MRQSRHRPREAAIDAFIDTDGQGYMNIAIELGVARTGSGSPRHRTLGVGLSPVADVTLSVSLGNNLVVRGDSLLPDSRGTLVGVYFYNLSMLVDGFCRKRMSNSTTFSGCSCCTQCPAPCTRPSACSPPHPVFGRPPSRSCPQ
jgi:hypothetical protein